MYRFGIENNLGVESSRQLVQAEALTCRASLYINWQTCLHQQRENDMKKTTKRMNRPERMDAVANGALKIESAMLRLTTNIRKRQGDWFYGG